MDCPVQPSCMGGGAGAMHIETCHLLDKAPTLQIRSHPSSLGGAVEGGEKLRHIIDPHVGSSRVTMMSFVPLLVQCVCFWPPVMTRLL